MIFNIKIFILLLPTIQRIVTIQRMSGEKQKNLLDELRNHLPNEKYIYNTKDSIYNRKNSILIKLSRKQNTFYLIYIYNQYDNEDFEYCITHYVGNAEIKHKKVNQDDLIPELTKMINDN